MAKTGTYNVQDAECNGKPTDEDSSYKSFLCILLVVIIICLLAILLALFLGSGTRQTNNKELVELIGNDALVGKQSNKSEQLQAARTSMSTSQEPTSTSQKTTSPHHTTTTTTTSTTTTTTQSSTTTGTPKTETTTVRRTTPTAGGTSGNFGQNRPNNTAATEGMFDFLKKEEEHNTEQSEDEDNDYDYEIYERNKFDKLHSNTTASSRLTSTSENLETTPSYQEPTSKATPKMATITSQRITPTTVVTSGNTSTNAPHVVQEKEASVEKSDKATTSRTDEATTQLETSPNTIKATEEDKKTITPSSKEPTTAAPVQSSGKLMLNTTTSPRILSYTTETTEEDETTVTLPTEGPTTALPIQSTQNVTRITILNTTTSPRIFSDTTVATTGDETTVTLPTEGPTTAVADQTTRNVTRVTILNTTTLLGSSSDTTEATTGDEITVTPSTKGQTTTAPVQGTQNVTGITILNTTASSGTSSDTTEATTGGEITETPTTAVPVKSTLKVTGIPILNTTTSRGTSSDTVTLSTKGPTTAVPVQSTQNVTGITLLNTTTSSGTSSDTTEATTGGEITETPTTAVPVKNTLKVTGIPILNTTTSRGISSDTVTLSTKGATTAVPIQSTQKLTHILNTTTSTGNSNYSTTEATEQVKTTITLSTKGPTTSQVFQNRSKSTARFKAAVSRMLSLMDHSAGQCGDFYMYSCGGAGAAGTPVGNSADDATWNSLLRQLNDVDTTDASDVPLAKLKTFHKSCLAHEDTFNYKARLVQVEAILEDIEVTNDAISVDRLTHLFAKLASMKSLPFMEVDVGIDTDSQKHVFQLSPPYRSLTQDEVQRWSTLYKIDMHCLKHTKYDHNAATVDMNKLYEKYTSCKKHYSSYLDSFNITTQAFDELANVDGLLWSIDNEILNFTSAAYTISSLRDDMVSDTHTTIKLTKLNEKFRAINWQLFFSLLSGHTLSDDADVHIYQQVGLFSIFSEFEVLQRRNFYDLLFAIYANDVYQNIIIPKAIDNRADYCVKLSSYLFSDVFSYLYMKLLPDTVEETSRKVVEEVFYVLKNQLKVAIHGQTWLEHPKSEMINKVNSLSYVMQDKADPCISKDHLAIKYKDVLIGDTFGANFVEMVAFRNKQKFALAGTIFNDTQLFCGDARPFDRQPSSLYSSTIIAIPYGMVQPWSLDYPSYFLMGKVGIKIAMAIMRYFDPVGIREIDLGQEAEEVYEKFSLIHNNEMYFGKTELSLKVSMESNYQNVRDNAAFRLTYSVFNRLSSNLIQDLPFIHDDFKDEEVFLISMAQEFCENLTPLEYMLRVYEGVSLPNYWRVNKMLVTSKRFKEFYNCKSGEKLNPAETDFDVFPDEVTLSDPLPGEESNADDIEY